MRRRRAWAIQGGRAGVQAAVRVCGRACGLVGFSGFGCRRGPFSGLADWWFSGLSGQPTVASVLFSWLRRWGARLGGLLLLGSSRGRGTESQPRSLRRWIEPGVRDGDGA